MSDSVTAPVVAKAKSKPELFFVSTLGSASGTPRIFKRRIPDTPTEDNPDCDPVEQCDSNHLVDLTDSANLGLIAAALNTGKGYDRNVLTVQESATVREKLRRSRVSEAQAAKQKKAGAA